MIARRDVRCCECDIWITSGDHVVPTVFGWAHPSCSPEVTS